MTYVPPATPMEFMERRGTTVEKLVEELKKIAEALAG